MNRLNLATVLLGWSSNTYAELHYVLNDLHTDVTLLVVLFLLLNIA